MENKVIIALDFPGANEVNDFLGLFQGDKPFVKIGMELFYAEGPEIVKKVKRLGHGVFLDLKLHDIPTTVKRAMKSLSGLDVDMVNLHASGGIDMMRAALEGLTRPDGTRAKLLAVTVLTSTTQDKLREELLVSQTMEETVAHYAKNAQIAGLDGVVCSPLEAALVKNACGQGFLTVTPGVRFADSAADDQARVMTPARARQGGSDYIVVGRPITAAGDPAAAYRRCVNEFEGGKA
jgi:orotidine-5'-phosphate decarboxylase